MNTRVTYLYRDANNYKVYEEVILEGELSPEQIQEIKKKLFDENCFIPSQVGLHHLHSQLQEFDTRDWGDDHPIHELEGISTIDADPTELMTATELQANFMAVNTWDTDMQVGHLLGGK
jgi:hypothetical protein